MNTTFHILVATDYSESVRNAERYAIQLAQNQLADVEFLHVYHSASPPPFPAFDLEPFIYDAFPKEAELLQQRVEEIKKSLGLNEKINFSCKVIEGGTIEEIITEAEAFSADLILMGKHANKGTFDFLWGSNTWNTMREAPCPVLVIPEDGLYRPIKKIAYITEYKEDEITAINYLKGIVSGKESTSLVLLHISPFGTSMPLENIVFENFLKDLSRQLPYEKFYFSLLHGEDGMKVLNDYCQKEEIDWLAVSPNKSSILESLFSPGNKLAKRMSSETIVPLLAIPPGYERKNAFFMYEEEYHIET